MSIKTISILLIVFGLIIVFIAMGMDTAVGYGESRVHNLSLAARQQNMLIIGGFCFMAGIILFALAKLKQTPEAESKEKAETEALIRATGDSIKRAGEAANSSTQVLLQRDNLPGRIAVGLFVGSCFYLWTQLLFSLVVEYNHNDYAPGSISSLALQLNWLFAIGFIAFNFYALRKIPAFMVMTRLLVVNVTLFAMLSIPIANIIHIHLTDYGFEVNGAWAFSLAMACVLPILISCGVIWVIKRSTKRKMDTSANDLYPADEFVVETMNQQSDFADAKLKFENRGASDDNDKL